jgi:hypothetical protein
MSRVLQDAIRAIWGVLLLVPMPWRTGLAIGIVTIGGYQILRRLLPLLLIPEFWITSQMRRLGHRPLPGTYAFGDFIGWAIKASRWLAWVAIIGVGAGIIAWYARPSMGDTTLAAYVDQGVTWWYSLEGWALTGKWALPVHAAPLVEPGIGSPMPSRGTVTPKPATTPGARVTPTPTPPYTIYVVQSGDSLSKIAKRFGVSVEDIVEANRVKYPSLVTDPASIEIDWKLRIPR